MKFIPPAPVQTPFMNDRPDSDQTPRHASHPWNRWFQQVAAISVPEYGAEVPGGQVGGSNRVFTLTNAPNPESSVDFYIVSAAGIMQLQAPSLYVVSGNKVTFNYPPQGKSAYVRYQF